MANFIMIPKVELMDIMERFIKDKRRGISINLFAGLCGLSLRELTYVFVDRVVPISERTQIKVSKGYHEWKSGHVRVMRRRDGTKFWEYRAEPKPIARRTYQLIGHNGQIGLKIGIKNASDYSTPNLLKDKGK